jgi:hypothetical protein
MIEDADRQTSHLTCLLLRQHTEQGDDGDKAEACRQDFHTHGHQGFLSRKAAGSNVT